MKTRACLIMLMLGLLAGEPALADRGRDRKIAPDEVRALVASGDLMPLDEILRRNEAEIGGRIIDIELERKGDGYVYEITFLRLDGRKSELKIDGRTGVIVRRSR